MAMRALFTYFGIPSMYDMIVTTHVITIITFSTYLEFKSF